MNSVFNAITFGRYFIVEGKSIFLFLEITEKQLEKQFPIMQLLVWLLAGHWCAFSFRPTMSAVQDILPWYHKLSGMFSSRMCMRINWMNTHMNKHMIIYLHLMYSVQWNAIVHRFCWCLFKSDELLNFVSLKYKNLKKLEKKKELNAIYSFVMAQKYSEFVLKSDKKGWNWTKS